MGIEIERKFLINPERLGPLPPGDIIKQGYIPTRNNATVRIRVRGDQAYLTLKGPTQGLRRSEFEYAIPVEDAEAMLNQLCSDGVIEKTRHLVACGTHTWEIDVFSGNNQGLIVAEVELNDEQESIVLPDWVTQEVTGDPRYYNSNLRQHPFCLWDDNPTSLI